MDHRVPALDQQVRTASRRLRLRCLVRINSVIRPALIQLSPRQHPVHHSRHDVFRMTRTGYLGLARRLRCPFNPIFQTSTNRTPLLFRRYRISTAKADAQCQVRSQTCSTLTLEESLRRGLPGLLHCAAKTPANRLLREVRTRKAAQVTMMKVKAFKLTLYLTARAMELVCVLKVLRRGKGEASAKRVTGFRSNRPGFTHSILRFEI